MMSSSSHQLDYNAAVLEHARAHPINAAVYGGADSIDVIKDQANKTVFARFDNNVAFLVGDAIRHLYAAQSTSTGILIAIRLFSGLTLFQAACGENVNPTNEDWVRRKYNTVRDFGISTLQKGRELEKKGRDINSLGPDFAAHGGGYPICIKVSASYRCASQ